MSVESVASSSASVVEAADEGSESSGQHGTESSSKPSSDGELARLQRKQRTAKARMASLLSRQHKKLQAQHEGQIRTTADSVSSFQRNYFAGRMASKAWWNPFEEIHFERAPHDRRRAVWLYFTSLINAVKRLFLGNSSGSEGPEQVAPVISHVLSFNINDDTNIKLQGHRTSRSVHSVMSNVQHHMAFMRTDPSEPSESSEPTWFVVQQPLVALQRATGSHLCQQFLAWSLHFAGYIGYRLQSWGLPGNLFQRVRCQVFVSVCDALKANNTVFRQLSKIVHYQRQQRQAPSNTEEAQPCESYVLQVHCMIHQCSLTRRTMVLGFEGFWSTLVRLGHLFESHSFRQRFQAALAKLVHENFQYIQCGSCMPPDAVHWREKKIRCLRLYCDHGHGGLVGATLSKRLKQLLKHIEKDNGDPEGGLIVHWCAGQTCCPGGEPEALATLVESFSKLFDNTVVPLLYRWKHAAQASNFVRDGFFLHRILPRTLELLPSMRGDLASFMFKCPGFTLVQGQKSKGPGSSRQCVCSMPSIQQMKGFRDVNGHIRTRRTRCEGSILLL